MADLFPICVLAGQKVVNYSCSTSVGQSFKTAASRTSNKQRPLVTCFDTMLNKGGLKSFKLFCINWHLNKMHIILCFNSTNFQLFCNDCMTERLWLTPSRCSSAIVPCGIPKKRPRTSSIVQFIIHYENTPI